MPKLPPRSRGSRQFYIERKNCPKINFLCADLGFLDCTFSNNDPLDKLELKKIQKVTSEVISEVIPEVISDVRNAEVARGHDASAAPPPLQHFSALVPRGLPELHTFQHLSRRP